jgi:hypothetical protein
MSTKLTLEPSRVKNNCCSLMKLHCQVQFKDVVDSQMFFLDSSRLLFHPRLISFWKKSKVNEERRKYGNKCTCMKWNSPSPLAHHLQMTFTGVESKNYLASVVWHFTGKTVRSVSFLNVCFFFEKTTADSRGVWRISKHFALHMSILDCRRQLRRGEEQTLPVHLVTNWHS